MVVSERHLFNRLLGNTDNELGAALRPTVRHTLTHKEPRVLRRETKVPSFFGNAVIQVLW